MMNSFFQGTRFKKNILEQTFAEITWKPVIERADEPNAYLISLPHDSLVKGIFQRVPLLMGIVSEESLCKYCLIQYRFH